MPPKPNENQLLGSRKKSGQATKKITFAALTKRLPKFLKLRKSVAIKTNIMSKGPVSNFIEHHYRHFNAAALMDAAKGYVTHLEEGGKMMITLAGAMSTAELGLSLAEMIRQDKVAIISCTGANLEEDIMNLVAHSHYKRVPNYRDLSPQEEWELLENHYNRVTDTCILPYFMNMLLQPAESFLFRYAGIGNTVVMVL